MNTRLGLRGIALTLGKFTLRIDLDFELGCVGIFGPSGAGKTTLLELIAGLRRAPSGRIEFDGQILAEPLSRKWIPPHRRGIGYVPQDLALFPHLNVRGNILYGAGENSFAEIANILDLEPLLDRRIDHLSGGEKQRVALARALAAKPRLLLLDEPLTGLDLERKDNAIDYLRALRERWSMPMIYVSHQADEIAALCDDVLVLRDGAVQAHGKPAEIFEPADRPGLRLRTL